MKVCMLAYTFYESDNRVMRYADALIQRGDDVEVIALRKEGQASFGEMGGVRIYRIQERKINEKGQLSYLIRIFKFFLKSSIILTKKHLRCPYDLIHVHSVPDFEVFAALLPKLLGANVILDIHDIVPEFYASKFCTSRNSFLYKSLLIIERLSSRFSDHVIISNHLWGRRILARSVPDDKCTVILNYPDSYIFRKRDKNEPVNTLVALYPGSLNWHQGIDLALKAIAMIKNKLSNFEFHIYGEGPTRNFLRDMIVELGLQGEVFLKESVPMENIAEIMANADLGIIPKRNDSFGGEAFSTKTLEFMALGVPIIVSRTKIDNYYFNDSIVRFFEPGNVEDLASAIFEMAKNKELRERLARNALKFVEKYRWENNKHIYLNLVDSFVSKNDSKSTKLQRAK